MEMGRFMLAPSRKFGENDAPGSSCLAQRVQVPIYQILRPPSAHIESPLRPKYIIWEYLDPLGCFDPGFGVGRGMMLQRSGFYGKASFKDKRRLNQANVDRDRACIKRNRTSNSGGTTKN